MVWIFCSLTQPATAQSPVAAAVPSQVVDVSEIVEVALSRAGRISHNTWKFAQY